MSSESIIKGMEEAIDMKKEQLEREGKLVDGVMMEEGVEKPPILKGLSAEFPYAKMSVGQSFVIPRDLSSNQATTLRKALKRDLPQMEFDIRLVKGKQYRVWRDS